MNNEPTPRTDANVKRHNLCRLSGNDLVYADFPRQLERELAELQEHVALCHDALGESRGSDTSELHTYFSDYKNKLLQLTKVTKQRDEALHQMEKYAAEAKLAINAHESAFRERNEAREQRDRLAEALRFATAYPLTESWYKQAIEALATLKP